MVLKPSAEIVLPPRLFVVAVLSSFFSLLFRVCRYLNVKCVRAAIRANRMEDAERIVMLFLKVIDWRFCVSENISIVHKHTRRLKMYSCLVRKVRAFMYETR